MVPSGWRIYTDKTQNEQGVGHIWVIGTEKPTVCHYAEDMCVCILDKEERKTHEKHEVGKDHENQMMQWSKRKVRQILQCSK